MKAPQVRHIQQRLRRQQQQLAGAQGQAVLHQRQLGLRAQLQTPSLLTGKAIVALDMFPDQAGYVFSPGEIDLPSIPSVPSRIDQAATLLQDLARSLSEVPLGELIESANRTLQAIEKLSR